MHAKGCCTYILDCDNVRSKLNKDLGLRMPIGLKYPSYCERRASVRYSRRLSHNEADNRYEKQSKDKGVIPNS